MSVFPACFCGYKITSLYFLWWCSSRTHIRFLFWEFFNIQSHPDYVKHEQLDWGQVKAKNMPRLGQWKDSSAVLFMCLGTVESNTAHPFRKWTALNLIVSQPLCWNTEPKQWKTSRLYCILVFVFPFKLIRSFFSVPANIRGSRGMCAAFYVRGSIPVVTVKWLWNDSDYMSSRYLSVILKRFFYCRRVHLQKMCGSQ